MTWSIVQVAQSGTGGTANFGSNTTAGNLIVVCVSNDGAVTNDPTSVTLTGSSDTFAKDINAAETNPTANTNLSFWSDLSCSAGHTAIVASGGLGTGVLINAWEVHCDIPGAVSFGGGHGSGSPASTAQSSFDSGAMASIPSGYLGLAAVVGIGTGGVRAAASISGSGTWTPETAIQPGSVTQLLCARQNPLPSGTPKYNGTFTAPAGGAFWNAIIASYKPPATAGVSGLLAASYV